MAATQPFTDAELFALRSDFFTDQQLDGLAHEIAGTKRALEAAELNQSELRQFIEDRLRRFEFKTYKKFHPEVISTIARWLKDPARMSIHDRQDLAISVISDQSFSLGAEGHQTISPAFATGAFWLAVHRLPRLAAKNGGKLRLVDMRYSAAARELSFAVHGDVVEEAFNETVQCFDGHMTVIDISFDQTSKRYVIRISADAPRAHA
jgi:hypothetical protein